MDKIDLILSRLDDLARVVQNNRVSPWFSAIDAARHLRVSESTINRLADRGLLPYYRVNPAAPKGQRRFHRRDLTALVVTGRNAQQQRLSRSEKLRVDELL